MYVRQQSITFSKRSEEYFTVITLFVFGNIKYKTTITTSSLIQIDGITIYKTTL